MNRNAMISLFILVTLNSENLHGRVEGASTPPASKSTSVVLTEGSLGCVPCRVSSRKGLMVTWLKGQTNTNAALVIRQDMTTGSEKKMVGRDYDGNQNVRVDIDSSFSLLINSVMKSDEGRYFCEVTEDEKLLYNHTDVTVKGMVETIQVLTAQRGSTVYLPCQFTGNTRFARVTWLKLKSLDKKGAEFIITYDYADQKIWGEGVDRERFDIAKDNELVIHNITSADRARFICELSDPDSDDIVSNHTDIIVTEVPILYERQEPTSNNNEVQYPVCGLSVFNERSVYVDCRFNISKDSLSFRDTYHVYNTPLDSSIRQNSLIILTLVNTVVIIMGFVLIFKGHLRKVSTGFLNNSHDSLQVDEETVLLPKQRPMRTERGLVFKTGRWRSAGVTQSDVDETKVARRSAKTKVYNDPIHGSIEIQEYCQIIIDTPEFQRLRYVKQLGCTSFVYPSAVHTVFEHSIGVSYFAGQLMDVLKQDTNNDITEEEAICVEIAALCRNLGRCPFWRAFQDIIRQRENRDRWTHDEQSAFVFEHILKNETLKEQLGQFGIHDDEIRFICELIVGGSRRADGRLEKGEKYFLYQIVNNSLNGVDVDKWDSLVRDAFYLGIPSAFNFKRLLTCVKVSLVKRSEECVRREICFRDKVADNLNQMHLTGVSLRSAAYEHRVCKVIREMLKDAFIAADPYLRTVGECGISLRSWVWDEKAFRRLTDGIVLEIMVFQPEDEGTAKACELIDRIHSRNLYKCIKEFKHAEKRLRSFDIEEIKECLRGRADDPSLSDRESDSRMWLPENIFVEISPVDFGRGGENPFHNIPLYGKSNGNGNLDSPFLYEEDPAPNGSEQRQDTTVRIYTKLCPTQHPVTDMDRRRLIDRLKAGGIYV